MVLLSSGREQTTPDPGHRQVGKLHTPVPSWAGTQERDHETKRTPKREPPEARIPEDPVARLGQQVDTRSKQVDTSLRFQKGRSTLAQGRSTLDPVSSRPVLQKWDSRSTLDLGRLTHSRNSVT
ncbi:hypothetical protein Taro_004576 [Colocasia esculenta]|uniref:Uncharacterized protein n=1 Tax=Colocasia esculenta TaxID=4460 RepID=A0A843TS23_COLES|nr:hypothetical protein [Colocasia esculenta]